MKMQWTKAIFLIGAIITSTAGAAPLSGVYVVPISNEEAVNPIPNILLKRSGQKVQFGYQLPEDLIGPGGQNFLLNLVEENHSGNTTELLFVARGAQADCVAEGYKINCEIVYQEVKINQEARENFLKRKYAHNPRRLANKLIVADSFSSDPIGVLEIKCPKLRCGF